jgi:hypothetical protein
MTSDSNSSHKWKDRQHNGQKKKDNWTNNDLQNTIQKIKDRVNYSDSARHSSRAIHPPISELVLKNFINN